MSIRIAASCGHDRHESSVPRGARISRALTLAMIVRDGGRLAVASGRLLGRTRPGEDLADAREELRACRTA